MNFIFNKEYMPLRKVINVVHVLAEIMYKQKIGAISPSCG